MCNMDGDMSTKFWSESSSVSATPSPPAAPSSPSSADGKGHNDNCDNLAPCRPVSHCGEERWWVPTLCVTKLGLMQSARRDLRQKHECANQIHMENPESYTQTLPKFRWARVGDIIYRHMLFPSNFSLDYLIDYLEILLEH